MPSRALLFVHTLLLVALLVVCGIQLGLANTSRKRIKQLTTQQAWLLQRVEEVEGWLATPEMKGLEAVEIDGQWVKTMPYGLADDPALERFATLRHIRLQLFVHSPNAPMAGRELISLTQQCRLLVQQISAGLNFELTVG